MKFTNKMNMKLVKYIIITIAVAAFVIYPINAKSSVFHDDEELTQEEKTELSLKIKQNLEDFQDYLRTITSNDVSSEVKDMAIENALNLFIGKGKPYIMYDPYSNDKIWNEGVKMQTSSSRGTKRVQLMSTYLNRLKGMIGGIYSKIIIESADAVKVDDIYATGDGRYMCTAIICQHFCGYSENGYVQYEDWTTKKIKIHIDKTTIAIPDGEKNIWKIRLGDMNVIDTWH